MGSGGLNDDEIEKMVRDAELHAEDDKKRKEKVEAHNELDTLIYSTEKSIEEHGDKLSEELKGKLTEAIEAGKKELETEDVEVLKEKAKSLSELTLKIGEEIYGSKGSAGDA